MSNLSISLEWFLKEDELKPDSFSKNHKIETEKIIENIFFIFPPKVNKIPLI